MVALQLSDLSQQLGVLPTFSATVESLGYSATWVGEINAFDAVAPASLLALGSRSMTIGALFNVYTRSPTNVAISGAGLANLAPSRIAIVLGASSPVLVEQWSGIPFARPLARVNDYLRFLRMAFEGTSVKATFRTFESRGFRLEIPPAYPPQVLLAAAGPRMMSLASQAGDGVVLNWVAPADLERLRELQCDRDHIWLSTIVCPTSDRRSVEAIVRPLMTSYLSVPAYARLQREVGRGKALTPLWETWASGDRAGAESQLPGSVIDELVIWGNPHDCGSRMRELEARFGARLIATVLLPPGVAYQDVIARMALGRTPGAHLCSPSSS